LPSDAHVKHCCSHWKFTHSWVPGQVPQLSVLPHPSLTEPQPAPSDAHVSGTQPHTLAVPPPTHVCGAEHGPQFSVPPQPFGMLPQFFPAAAQVVGVQPHTLADPAPPHVSGLVQLPQLSDPPHLSLMLPQSLPSAAQVVAVQPRSCPCRTGSDPRRRRSHRPRTARQDPIFRPFSLACAVLGLPSRERRLRRPRAHA
jgi:hypothetical protein